MQNSAELIFPEIVQSHILAFAPLSTLAVLARTSRKWHQLSKIESNWEVRFKRHFGHYVEDLNFKQFGINYREAFIAAEQQDYRTRNSPSHDNNDTPPWISYHSCIYGYCPFPAKLITLFRAVKNSDSSGLQSALATIDTLTEFLKMVETRDQHDLNLLQWAGYFASHVSRVIIFTRFQELFIEHFDTSPEITLSALSEEGLALWWTMIVRCDRSEHVARFIETLPNYDYHNTNPAIAHHTALHEACDYNAEKTCAVLMEKFDDMYNANAYQASPLHYAAKIGSHRLVSALTPHCDSRTIARAGSNDHLGDNAIKTAIIWRNSSAVAELAHEETQYHTVPLTAENQFGYEYHHQPAICFALAKHRYAEACYLLCYTKQPNRILLKILPIFSNAWRHMDPTLRQKFGDELFRQILPMYQAESVVDFQERDSDDNNLLHWIVACNQMAWLEYNGHRLAESKKLVSKQNKSNQTPFELAVLIGNLPMCQRLNTFDTPINPLSLCKLSMAFVAINHDHPHVLAWLCTDHSFDLHHEFEAPLTQAVFTNSARMVITLLDHPRCSSAVTKGFVYSPLQAAVQKNKMNAFKAIMQHPRAHEIKSSHLTNLLRWVRDDSPHVSSVMQGYQFPMAYTNRWQALTARELPIAVNVREFFQECDARRTSVRETMHRLWQYYVISSALLLMLQRYINDYDRFNIFSYTVSMMHELQARFSPPLPDIEVPPTEQVAACQQLIHALSNPELSHEDIVQLLIDADNNYPKDANLSDDYIRRVHFCIWQIRTMQHAWALENSPHDLPEESSAPLEPPTLFF